MSMLTCLKFGTATGLVGGLISSAYFSGAADRANKNDNSAFFVFGSLSVVTPIVGPLIGAAAGVSFYGLNRSIKHLRAIPKSHQLAVLSLISLGIAIKGAYTLGQKG